VARWTWLILLAVLALETVWVARGGFTVAWLGVRWALTMVAVALACHGIARFFRADASILALTECVALLFAQCMFGPLSYLAASVGGPLQDDRLDGLDRALGFNWSGFNASVAAHPWVQATLIHAYDSPPLQLGLLLLVVCYRHHQQVREFVLALTFTLIAAIVIASLAPALGAHIQHGAPVPALQQGIDDLLALRSGSLRRLSLPDIQGIISFPSFHAAMGVFLAWGMRRPRWLFTVAAPVNAVMLASTLTAGGHYLIDVIAGVAIAAASAWAATLARRSDRRADVAPAAALA
jgi:membrane-associated phospholipid phosphatase